MPAGNESAKKNSKPQNEKRKRQLAGTGDLPPSWRRPKQWDQGWSDLFVPTLRFTPYAWSKLLFLRDLDDTEVGGFGISSEYDLFLIEDVRLIRQKCTALTVAFEDEAVADFFDEQIDAGRQPERIGRVWVHTHPEDCAEPSSTDEETFDRAFSGSNWTVMFILARGGETYARLKFDYGPGAELRVPVAIDWDAPFPASDHDAWVAEYECCVRPIAPSPIRSSNQLSPEDKAFLEANPDLLEEFGFPFLDYDDPHLESDLAFHDYPDDFRPL